MYDYCDIFYTMDFVISATHWATSSISSSLLNLIKSTVILGYSSSCIISYSFTYCSIKSKGMMSSPSSCSTETSSCLLDAWLIISLSSVMILEATSTTSQSESLWNYWGFCYDYFLISIETSQGLCIFSLDGRLGLIILFYFLSTVASPLLISIRPYAFFCSLSTSLIITPSCSLFR